MTMPSISFKSSVLLRGQTSQSMALIHNRLFSHSLYDAISKRHNLLVVSYPGRCRNLEKFRENLKREKTSAYLNYRSPVSCKRGSLRRVLNCYLNRYRHSKEDIKLLRKIFVSDAAICDV